MCVVLLSKAQLCSYMIIEESFIESCLQRKLVVVAVGLEYVPCIGRNQSSVLCSSIDM